MNTTTEPGLDPVCSITPRGRRESPGDGRPRLQTAAPRLLPFKDGDPSEMRASAVIGRAHGLGVLAFPARESERGMVLLGSLWPNVQERTRKLLGMHERREIELVSVPQWSAAASLAERGVSERMLAASLIVSPAGESFDAVAVEARPWLLHEPPKFRQLLVLDEWARAIGDHALRIAVEVAMSPDDHHRGQVREARRACVAAWNRRSGLLPAADRPTRRQWVEFRKIAEDGIRRPKMPMVFIHCVVDRGWIEPVIGTGGKYRLTEAGRDVLRVGNQLYLRRQLPPRKPGAWTDSIR